MITEDAIEGAMREARSMRVSELVSIAVGYFIALDQASNRLGCPYDEIPEPLKTFLDEMTNVMEDPRVDG